MSAMTPDPRLVALDADPVAWRRQVIFRCFKWDPQVGDQNTIADHACILSQCDMAVLEEQAQALAGETIMLENALRDRPDLYPELGLGARLAAQLRQADLPQPGARIMRFDFHPTADGWALSEVNSDVPGGFAEASTLPQMAAAHVGDAVPRGDVGTALVEAMKRQLKAGARIGLVHATAYADDRQVMRFLASRIAEAGFEGRLIAPDHIRWEEGRAIALGGGPQIALDGILRFFPAEWLAMLPRQAGWQGYFRNRVFACNPITALLSQSKRCPLVWDRLGLAMAAWRRALPATRDPRDVPWRRDEGWMLKPAFGRVGEGLAWRGGVSRKLWRRAQWQTILHPRQWVAQRRFESLPIMSGAGPRHLCVGVFTVDGRAAGFYGRMSAQPVIDKHAQDVAVLVRKGVS